MRRMFGAIAPRYDLLNHLLSLNVDRRWRRQAVDRLLEGRPPEGRFLDACAGTLDLGLELAARPGFDGLVVGSDFALPMLERGREKVGAAAVAPCGADVLELPFADGTFEGVTVGFGVRNLADVERGLRELLRVLRPGGRLVVLEFSTPSRQPLRAAYLAYFVHILPRVGRWISGHGRAYDYLPASVLEFPEPDALADLLRHTGFERSRWWRLSGGIAAIHVAERPSRTS